MISIPEIYEVYKKHPLVCTDTRKIVKGAIFFALKGESFDGNVYAEEALSQGCSFAVIDNKEYEKGKQYLLVDDVLKTLQDLAHWHRMQLKGTCFIALTGSNGKTTTKELIHAVLSAKYQTTCTQGNLNNHIGVPLTLLSVQSNHQFAIIEMGANHQGEIKSLASIVQPDFGLITNIGKAHIEGFGSFEGIIAGKTELYQQLNQTKKHVFINADNSILENEIRKYNDVLSIKYGTSSSLSIYGEIFEGASETLQFYLCQQQHKVLIKTNLYGNYNFENALAASSIGLYFGLTLDEVKKAIENYIPSNNRSQVHKTPKNTLILDLYNANPTSMEAAIKNFALKAENNKCLIIGEMLELGLDSKKEHEDIIALIQKHNFKSVFFVGKEFAKVNIPSEYKYFNSTAVLKTHLTAHPLNNAVILLKGSRGNKLEQLMEVL
jgi:UDP-N-acetylmuramoyl-tripeptide--D-alanyl-D-alanine ligase